MRKLRIQGLANGDGDGNSEGAFYHVAWPVIHSILLDRDQKRLQQLGSKGHLGAKTHRRNLGWINGFLSLWTIILIMTYYDILWPSWFMMTIKIDWFSLMFYPFEASWLMTLWTVRSAILRAPSLEFDRGGVNPGVRLGKCGVCALTKPKGATCMVFLYQHLR